MGMFEKFICAFVCPFCGILFFTSKTVSRSCCPDCHRNFTLSNGALLEANLDAEGHDN